MNYDRILYVKDKTYYFDRIDGSKISKVSSKHRKIIIDGLLNPDVKEVKCLNKRIFYYYKSGRNRYFLCQK